MNHPPAGAIQLDFFAPTPRRWSDPLPREMSIDAWLGRCAELNLTALRMTREDKADPPSWVVHVRSTDRRHDIQAWAYDLNQALGFAIEGVERDCAGMTS